MTKERHLPTRDRAMKVKKRAIFQSGPDVEPKRKSQGTDRIA
jgi:hypothetical protein